MSCKFCGDNKVDLITKIETWAVRIAGLLTFLGVLLATFIREWRQMGLIWIVVTLCCLALTTGLVIWLFRRRSNTSAEL
jgi:hypothetical protein